MSQTTLTGSKAERVECEYRDICGNPAQYQLTVLENYEELVPIKVCKSCADEHTEIWDDKKIQERRRWLKPAERWKGETVPPETVWIVAANFDADPHPHILGVFDEEEPARELMDDCRDRFTEPHPIAWDIFEEPITEESEGGKCTR